MAQARVPIDNFLAQNADNLNDPRIFMQAGRMMTDYNIAAKQMGQPEFDTSLLTQLQKMGEVSVTKSNQGGYTSWVAVKKNGGSFGVDKNGKPIYAVPIMKEAKTPTWKEQQDVGLKKAKLIEDNAVHKVDVDKIRTGSLKPLCRIRKNSCVSVPIAARHVCFKLVKVNVVH